MNRVDVAASGAPLPAWAQRAETFMVKTLEKLDRHNWDVSILFCNDAFIRELNGRYRNKDEATDVLSFPLGETVNEDGEDRHIPGDIVISLESLTENARRFNVSEDEELRRLLIHGILHLNGFNHAIDDISAEALRVEPMLALQEKIIRELSGDAIIC
ncbi:MAG: rRNA maturation RNase YbeY [Spirochaetaceae bacterium]|jgi:probable rRNA maturation factor|nr:rRNA maturation RNase YbeY [Spirochaetaceae bacterium]